MPVSLAVSHEILAPVVADAFPWERWQDLVASAGIVIDRPRHRPHPTFPDIVYPLDYGYVAGTSSGDGDAVDVFAGSRSDLGLVGLVLTTDRRRGDREVKLLWGTPPDEVYLALGFLNFDRRLLDGVLVLRAPMRALWKRVGVG